MSGGAASWWGVVVVVVGMACAGAVHGGFATPAYRVLQYQYSGGEFGPQQAAVNLQAITYERAQEVLTAATSSSIVLARRAVLLPFAKATPSVVQQFKEACGAIVILLPARLSSSSQLSNWTDFERWVVKQQFPIPVYYVWESSEWTALYDDLNHNFGGGDLMEQLWPLANSYQIEVEADAVKKRPLVRLPTLQGTPLRRVPCVPHVDVFAWQAFSVVREITSERSQLSLTTTRSPPPLLWRRGSMRTEAAWLHCLSSLAFSRPFICERDPKVTTTSCS